MDIIHLLPDSVANQIAAGEVIQRPASCLKELVENSLDAGAQHVSVLVRDAGRTLLQVTDDGRGMSETDARMAFERHATSKIAQAQDLFALRTMGFRGEALASICAVAQVEVQTRRAEDEVGTLLEIHGSQVVRQEPCQCAVGTSMRVKNLFYNVPVRRKFLKTDQTELRNLLSDFYRIVLVYPDVQFTFVNDDEVMLDLTAGTYKQRIEQVFGKGTGRSYTGQFVDVQTQTELVRIHGFVGKPESAGRNAQQYFFVNGRYMRHPYFHKAVMNAYSGMLPGELVPSYFIYFEIAPESIDVNIHPTKTEIKFADEQAVFQILMAAVRESLGKFNVAPSIDFDRNGEFEMPAVGDNTPAQAPRVHVDAAYNPFQSRSTIYPSRQASVPTQWQTLYSTAMPVAEDRLAVQEDGVKPFVWTEEQPLLGQYAGRYILLPMDGGLLFVNQHRAHVCVLCAIYEEQLQAQQAPTQQLLFPEVIDLTPDEMTLMQSLSPELESLGFALEQLSRSSYSISGVPALLGENSAVPVLRRILHDVSETGGAARDGWHRRIALAMARETAIPYGKILTEDEQRDLLRRFFALPVYRTTPDGKTTCFLLTDETLAKHFV